MAQSRCTRGRLTYKSKCFNEQLIQSITIKGTLAQSIRHRTKLRIGQLCKLSADRIDKPHFLTITFKTPISTIGEYFRQIVGHKEKSIQLSFRNTLQHNTKDLPSFRIGRSFARRSLKTACNSLRLLEEKLHAFLQVAWWRDYHQATKHSACPLFRRRNSRH